jgi:phage I-like protein
MGTMQQREFRTRHKLADFAEDGKVPERVQILKVGTYYHPEYGKLEITTETLRTFKENFDANVRGIDCAIDYKHDSDDIAAGWFRSVELSADGNELWVETEWTKNGERVVAEKEFRYFSADFDFEYQDNETLQVFGPTLCGAALTNRPFIKGMAPTVELTEGKGLLKMKTVETLQAEVTKLTETNAALTAKNAKLEDMVKPLGTATPEDMVKKCAELEEKLAAALAENAKLKETSAGAAQVAALAEKKGKFDRLLSEGKANEAQREAFMSGDSVKFAELSKPINLSDAGHGKEGDGKPVVKTAADAEIEIAKQAKALLSEGKVKSFGDGVRRVLSENPELKKARETA